MPGGWDPKGKSHIWGDTPALIAQLEIRYGDGSTDNFISDASWKSSTGAILSSSIYDGETRDARQEPTGWLDPVFSDRQWRGVKTVPYDKGKLVSPASPPVRRVGTLLPQSIAASPSGSWIIDFGQNLVGRVRIRIPRTEKGSTITLRHAEVLEDGEPAFRPLRSAEATDRYICSGEDPELWEPLFTYHGFRYVEIDGWPGKPGEDDIAAIVCHSDMERTGWLETSDPLINRLHENIRWSMKGNFLLVPTDCPQRDERLGWTGDIQVFSPAAAFLYNSAGFLRSWLRDLYFEQNKIGGQVPPVVPNALGEIFGAAAWGDAATVVPWVLYRRYGDISAVSEQFDSMCAWVDYVADSAGENLLWDTGFQFGDWLDPAAPPDRPWESRTSRELVASAYFVHSARITEKAAELLGNREKQERYSRIARKGAEAFRREYVTPSGRLMNDTETAYSLAIIFDLYDTDEQKRHGGDRLAELVRDGEFRIKTGFVGTPLICDALSMTGHFREAYRLLTCRRLPSWLYPVTMGATTVWERWDSMLPDGTVNPGEMTSFNHYALGAVADWMYRTIGGITEEEPGYRRFMVAPRPGGGISSSAVVFISPYGKIECTWRIEEGNLFLNCTVPPNTNARILLPGYSGVHDVGSGTWNWRIPYKDPDTRGAFTADDITGEILSDPQAVQLVLRVLEKFEAPDFLRTVLFTERKVPLSGILDMLPDSRGAIEYMNRLFAEHFSDEGA